MTGGCAVAATVAFALAGCTSAGANEPGADEPGAPKIRLDSSLTTPHDVRLQWQGHDSDTIVEFATEADGRYTILEFLPADRRTFDHPDLMPDTTFYYRVRPVLGPAAQPVAVTEPATPVSGGGEDWLVPRTVPDSRANPVSVRERDAAPTNLLAESGPDGVLLTWTDNSTDEAGFLIETKVGADFQVVFVVDPDINSAGVITEDDGTAATYRVRAYYFGEQSNVVHEQTGG